MVTLVLTGISWGGGGHFVCCRFYSSWERDIPMPLYCICRPVLISLDLSYNLLSDLEAAVQVLAEVSTLRNLLLMGNPLSVSTHTLVGEKTSKYCNHL
jgi:hypothetical protein